MASGRQLFCILDDERTRASGRLIQWHMGLDDATPVRARPYKSGSGLLDIGQRRNWLYSTELYPVPGELEDAVERLLAG